MNAVSWTIILTSITAIFGAALGGASLALGICNFLRDRPEVKVSLQWNMEMVGGDATKECGLVTVTNAGRRPVYLSHVALILPKSYKNRLLLLVDSVQGRKLSEGDPPMKFVVRHDIQTKYARELVSIRVRVSDSTGRIYRSKCPETQQGLPVN